MMHTLQAIVSNLERISRKNILLIFLCLLLATISCIVLAITLWRHSFTEHIDPSTRFPFVSKRIFVQNPNDVIINFVTLRKALKEYLAPEGGKVGVYFEYLPSGVSLGVNHSEEVRLASLSKVPLAMSILKKVEKRELRLNDVLYLKKEHLDQRFGDLWKRGEGAPVTIEKLIKSSLQESDNTAYQTLYSILTYKEVAEVYDNLEIEITSSSSTPYISPKSYSSIFRSLYLASFLFEKESNYLLDILTKTNFKDKIPAGVPDGVPIAHKIGVFDRADTPGKVYIDCGIVYAPLRPYILCIFVQDEEPVAVRHMSHISSMVYNYVIMAPGGN